MARASSASYPTWAAPIFVVSFPRSSGSVTGRALSAATVSTSRLSASVPSAAAPAITASVSTHLTVSAMDRATCCPRWRSRRAVTTALTAVGAQSAGAAAEGGAAPVAARWAAPGCGPLGVQEQPSGPVEAGWLHVLGDPRHDLPAIRVGTRDPLGPLGIPLSAHHRYIIYRVISFAGDGETAGKA